MLRRVDLYINIRMFRVNSGVFRDLSIVWE